MKPVHFESDGYKLKGTIYYPKQSNKKSVGVLLIHGWGTNETRYVERASAIAEAGAVAFTFDLRGHGASEGDITTFSRKDHLNDVIRAYDFLVKDRRIDINSMGVLGVSYGGYLASRLLSECSIKWLTYRAPALYPDSGFDVPTTKLIADNPTIFSQIDQTVRNNRALQNVSNFSGPVLLVESKNDRVISHETIECYLAALKNNELTYKIIEADHELTTPEMKKMFVDELGAWYHSEINKNS